jgi:antitoxin component of MazEF toxin-antitoxin module
MVTKILEIGSRKLSETSKGSLVVCIPRWWTRTQGLEKGDRIVFSLDGENLIITPKKDGEKEEGSV